MILKKFKNYSPEKESITLKNLLTMSSPFDGSDMNSESPGNEENMYPTNNWVDFALNLPIDPKKASENKWDYFTAGVVVLGDIIYKSVPNGLEKYADKKTFSAPRESLLTNGSIRHSKLPIRQEASNYARWILQNMGSSIRTKEHGMADRFSHKNGLLKFIPTNDYI